MTDAVVLGCEVVSLLGLLLRHVVEIFILLLTWHWRNYRLICCLQGMPHRYWRRCSWSCNCRDMRYQLIVYWGGYDGLSRRDSRYLIFFISQGWRRRFSWHLCNYNFIVVSWPSILLQGLCLIFMIYNRLFFSLTLSGHYIKLLIRMNLRSRSILGVVMGI